VKSWNILTRFMYLCCLWFTTKITGNYEFWSKFQKKRYGKNVSLILWQVELYLSESCTCVVCDTSLEEYQVIMSSGANSRKKRYGKNVILILWRVELYQSESCTCVVCDTSLQEYRLIMSSGANSRKKDIE
jgi:hypothetical protein